MAATSLRAPLAKPSAPTSSKMVKPASCNSGLCAEQALVGDARDLSALSGQSFDGFWRSVLFIILLQDPSGSLSCGRQGLF
jgi:hypothetical protein